MHLVSQAMNRQSTYQAARTVAHKVEEIFKKHRDKALTMVKTI
jgi:hypothetical protein